MSENNNDDNKDSGDDVGIIDFGHEPKRNRMVIEIQLCANGAKNTMSP